MSRSKRWVEPSEKFSRDGSGVAPQPILEVRGVSQRLGASTVLQDLNFAIYPGEGVVLVGPSGAGKSTLLRLLNGSLRPTEGEVWVLGQRLKTLSPRRLRRVQRQIGTIYQQFHLVENLPVIHNVNAGHLGRWPLWKAALSLVWPLEVATAAHALDQVGLGEKIYARTDQLSGGQQQRVALARVLVQNPQVVLADEPIASLDPERSRDLMALLGKTLMEGEGKTLVVSLHDLEYGAPWCQRILGLRRGRLLWDLPFQARTPALLDDLYRLGEEC